MIVEFEFQGYEVTADVSRVRDYYGTGDSPTMYDVEIIKAVDEEGEVFNGNDLSNTMLDAMEDEAIMYY